METKKCFKCGVVKPISDFYVHKEMKDGHLNKCIDCTKKDTKRRYDVLSQNEEWMDKERERGKEKFKRLGYAGRFKSPRSLCPQEANISKKLRVRGYDTRGKESHHWNYNNPHSIFLLSKKAHRTLHRHIKVNYSDKYCYTIDNERIDTEEKAKAVFSAILQKSEISDKLELINL